MAKLHVTSLALSSLSASGNNFLYGGNQRKATTKIKDTRWVFSTYHAYPFKVAGSVVQGAAVEHTIGPSSGLSPYEEGSASVLSMGLGYPGDLVVATPLDQAGWDAQKWSKITGFGWQMYGGTSANTAATLSSNGGGNVSCLLPASVVLPSIPDVVSISTSKVGLDETRALNSKVSIPEVIQLRKSALQHLFEVARSKHLRAYADAFKIESREPSTILLGEDDYQTEVWGTVPTTALTREKLTHTELHQIDIVYDTDTNKLFAVVLGSGPDGGNSEPVNIADDAVIAAAYAAKAEADAKLMNATELAKSHVTTPSSVLPLAERPPATSNTKIDFVNRSVLDDWWASYYEAVNALLAHVQSADYLGKTSKEVHASSGSELSYDDWLKEAHSKANATANTVSDQSTWDKFKKSVGGVVSGVGDYLGKWSPTEWVTAGAGIAAISTVSKSPQWFKLALIVGAGYLVLK